MSFTVARQLIVMAIIVVISFLFSKKNKFSADASNYVSRLLLYVINPCMILSTFNVPYEKSKMQELIFVLAISFLFHLVLTLIAIIFLQKKHCKNFSIGLDKLAVIFTNSGFIGIPLIKGVFGDEGVFYLMGYIFVFNIYLWTYGEYLMTGKINLKKIFTNPNVLACFGGLLFFLIPTTCPYVISEPLKMIGNCNGAVSMILLGMLFAEFKKPEGDTPYIKEVAVVSVLRLIVCPIFITLLTAFCYAFFGLHLKLFTAHIQMIMFVIMIAALCSVGMSISGFAVVFKKDPSYASLLVSITSALCVITIPLFVALSSWLISFISKFF